MTHSSIHAMIDRAFLDELSAEESADLRAHLSSCPGCRARYNRLMVAERVLSGGPAAVGRASERELDAARVRVFAAIDRDQRRAGRPLRAWLGGLLVATAAAAAAALFFVAVPPRGLEGEGTFRVRGATPGVRPATLRAFCVDGAGQARELSPEAPACPLGGLLELALANQGKYRHVFVVGVQEDLSPRWYSPRPPEERSVEAPPAEEGQVPFGPSIRLAVNHHAGPLVVHALFSDVPLAAADVTRAIQRSGKPDGAPLELGAGVEERSLRLEIAP